MWGECIGWFGSGTLSQTGGTNTVAAGNITIAAFPGSQGTYELRDGGILNMPAGSPINIGQEGLLLTDTNYSVVLDAIASIVAGAGTWQIGRDGSHSCKASVGSIVLGNVIIQNGTLTTDTAGPVTINNIRGPMSSHWIIGGTLSTNATIINDLDVGWIDLNAGSTLTTQGRLSNDSNDDKVHVDLIQGGGTWNIVPSAPGERGHAEACWMDLTYVVITGADSYLVTDGSKSSDFRNHIGSITGDGQWAIGDGTSDTEAVAESISLRSIVICETRSVDHRHRQHEKQRERRRSLRERHLAD